MSNSSKSRATVPGETTVGLRTVGGILGVGLIALIAVLVTRVWVDVETGVVVAAIAFVGVTTLVFLWLLSDRRKFLRDSRTNSAER